MGMRCAQTPLKTVMTVTNANPTVTSVTKSTSVEISFTKLVRVGGALTLPLHEWLGCEGGVSEHDPEKREPVFRKGHAQAESVAFTAFLERVTMRNALGLMLASVVMAVVIAGMWFWTSAPRADAAAPQTMAAKPAELLPPATARLAAKDDVAVTASISGKPAV